MQILIGLADRHSGFDRVFAPDLRAVVPGEGVGSAGPRRIDPRTQCLRLLREHYPGAACGFDQSGEGVAHGVAASRRAIKRRNLGAEGLSCVVSVVSGCCWSPFRLPFPHLRNIPPTSPSAHRPQSTPAYLKNAGLDQRLGTQIPLNLRFRTALGRRRAAGQVLRPASRSRWRWCTSSAPCCARRYCMGWPTRCAQTGYAPTRDYDVIVASIDPSELPPTLKRRGRSSCAAWRRCSGRQRALPDRRAAGDHCPGELDWLPLRAGARTRRQDDAVRSLERDHGRHARGQALEVS